MDIPTNDVDTERKGKRQKVKLVWKLGVMYTKPKSFLLGQIKEIRSTIHHITLEVAMMQRYIKDYQVDIPIESSRSSIDSCISEMSQSTSMDSPMTTLALLMFSNHGKRFKKHSLNFEQKLSISQHYMRWLSDQIELNKRINNAFIADLIATNENMDLTARTVQNELKYWMTKVGPDVCLERSKPGVVPVWKRQIPPEKFWAMGYVHDMKRDRNIRGAKLDNVVLLHKLQKQEEARIYEDRVDVTEFYRKLLENRGFPREIDKLSNKQMNLLKKTIQAERRVYNLRHHLHKRVVHGDQLRRRITKEKNMMGRVEHSLAMAVATRDKDQHTKEKLQRLMSDYAAPNLAEFVELSRQNEELKRMVRMFEKKVTVAKLIWDNNEQKLKRIMKQGRLSL